MSDDDTSLQDAIATGDRRASLVAIRDYLAHELEGSRCSKCAMSQLRTGDTAALVLRLTKVMEELDAMPLNNGEVSELDRIRERRNGTESTHLGTKSSARQQGGRRRGGLGKPGG